VDGEYQGETIIAKNSLSGTEGMDIEGYERNTPKKLGL
jgi:hypothetical protein